MCATNAVGGGDHTIIFSGRARVRLFLRGLVVCAFAQIMEGRARFRYPVTDIVCVCVFSFPLVFDLTFPLLFVLG